MISVVIPAYNEEKHLPSCLASLVRQKTRQQFEVIVVDNASTDRTALVAAQFASALLPAWRDSAHKAPLRLRIVKESTKGRGAARARGFAAARGEIILSTDADTIVPPDWVERYAQLLSDGVQAVTSTTTSTDGSWLTNWAIHILQPVSMHIYRGLIGHYWLSGFNFGITKRLYMKSGGFNRALNAYEDIDLAIRVHRFSPIRFVPLPKVQFSSRRFKHGLVVGMAQYVGVTIDYFVFRKPNITLGDVRQP